MDDGAAAEPARASRSAGKKDSSKKLAALWKKHLKLLKAKDPDKKREGLAYCAQNPQFFRDQPEVLPTLLSLLTRIKAPDIVLDTLATFESLLFTSVSDAQQEQRHPEDAVTPEMIDGERQVAEVEANALYMIHSSLASDAEYEGGQPFITLLSASVPAETKTKAIGIFSRLVEVVISKTTAEPGVLPQQALINYQAAGSPISALLSCITSSEIPLQFAALSCIARLLLSDQENRLLAEFSGQGGYPLILRFGQHAERRFHSVMLGILSTLSLRAAGREELKRLETLDIINQMIKETFDALATAAAAITAGGPTASTISPEDAARMGSDIPLMCQVFARVEFGHSPSRSDSQTESNQNTHLSQACLSFIDSIVYGLKKDVGNGVAALTPSTPPPATGNAAAIAAAAAAAANALAAASLFPFRAERVVSMLNSLGRMVERSEQCRNHALRKQVIGIALDCFKLPGQARLHQVADKLLHQCCVDGDLRSNDPSMTPRSPLAVKTLFQPSSNTAPGEVSEQRTAVNAEISVGAIASLLESLHEASDHASIFRLVRWLGLLVQAPENARPLGTRCPAVLLKILTGCSMYQHLLIGFLSQFIGLTIKANASTLESYEFDGMDPVYQFVAYLQHSQKRERAKEPHDSEVELGETEADVSSLLLEWIDERDEQDVFQPVTSTNHQLLMDSSVNVSKALLAILQAFEISSLSGETASNFWDLYSQHEAASGGHHGKPPPGLGLGATAPSKKRLDSQSAGAVGESTVLSLLCCSLDLLELVPVFAGSDPVVCATLLSVISKLLDLHGGSKVLLHLQSSRSEHAATPNINEENSAEVLSSDASRDHGQSWPIGVDNCTAFAHTALLQPILAVLHSSSTCFSEVEAAVRVLEILSSDQTSRVDKSDESVQDVDRFVNCAVASGALAVLISYLDNSRIPTASLSVTGETNPLDLFIARVEDLALRFINWGCQKQQAIESHDEGVHVTTPTETEDSAPTTDAYKDEDSTFERLWAKQLLDLRFDIPRFGYSCYSVLLLASEIGRTGVATALLNAGASANTASPAGTTPLMLAVLNRDEALASELLKHGADIDAITTDGRDQTVWLCTLVSSSEAHGLISKTYEAAVISATDLVVDPLPLLMSLDAIKGSPAALTDLMRLGLDVNVSDANGNFLLHAALSKAHVRHKQRGISLCFRYDSRDIDPKILTTLVIALIEEHGADVHKVNRLGQTPLHVALLYGHTDAVQLLLRHGANPNILDVHGYLPLHYASCGFCGTIDGSDGVAIELIELLLEACGRFPIATVEHIDDRKLKTPSEKVELELESVLTEGLLNITQPRAIVTKLASRDEVVSMASTADGFQPWHMTCGAFSHSPETLPLDDAMVSAFTSNGRVRNAILRYFVDACGIDTAKLAYKDVTALHLAIKSASAGCNDEVIESLLRDSSATNIPNRLNINAVHEVTIIDCLPPLTIGSEVTVVGVDPPDIHGFVSSRSLMKPSEYHILLSNGEHVEAVDRKRLRLADSSTALSSSLGRYYLFIESCFTALHYALQTSDEISRRLLAIPELTQKVEGIDIPFLALACAAHRSADVVKPLIGPSANVRVKLPLLTSSMNFRTGSSSGPGSRKKHAAALHYAVMYEDTAVIRELVASSDVNVNVRRSGDGFTPLHLACEIGNVEIITLLLEHGADVGQESSSSAQDSVTPLQLLVKNDIFADDAVRTLVLDKCQDLRLLFGEFIEPSQDNDGPGETSQFASHDVSKEEDHRTREITCFLLKMEQQNLHLYERIQELRGQRRAPSDLLACKFEIDLAKHDRALNDFFELIQSHKQQKCDEVPEGLDAALLFARLPHPHECFQQFKVRSAWVEVPDVVISQTVMTASS